MPVVWSAREDLAPGVSSPPRMRARVALLFAGLILAACSPATPSSAVKTIEPTSNGAILRVNDDENCSVTTPGQAPAEIGDQLFGSASAFGNDKLWVGGLGDGGVILADSGSVEADGSIGWKFGWWRIASGGLTISGRRLDAAAPPLRASVPSGYGSSGFQASGVSFPTEGCWEVTGTVGGSSLTFVTFVRRT